MLRSTSTPFTTMPSPSSSSTKPIKRPSTASHGGPGGSLHHSLTPSIGICASCKSSPSAATLDLLILLLVLFSCAFLIVSSLAHLARSLTAVLPPAPAFFAPFRDAPYPYLAGLLLFLVVSLAAAHLSCLRPCPLPWSSRRRCGNPRCRGLKKALEFDVQLQTEECIRSPDPAQSAAWKEIDDLPWKGGQQGNNPDYECLRAELRRMAPPNGRAVLLFRSRCGCPLAKLEAWGPKRGRRHKKVPANLAIEGGDR
ncbi:unnamed protein product [Musa acuminata subsp. burmannicoides]|uniref:Ribosomal protein L34e superfamily protein n=2 Tax=Musa acuminata subsp. malaccensis TaxID=214687 RepID=A0A804JA09_MUSAM|nr:PREDICTED: uncharacterized protein At5g19025-like [Musa acuminata subsp. malaccensis]